MAIKITRGSKNVWVPVILVAAICGALFPVTVYPYLHIEQYRMFSMSLSTIFHFHHCLLPTEETQKKNRAGLRQEEIQPGNMRVWSNPFEPRPDK